MSDRNWEQHFIDTICPVCDRTADGQTCSFRDRDMVCEHIHDCAYGAEVAIGLLSAERLSEEDIRREADRVMNSEGDVDGYYNGGVDGFQLGAKWAQSRLLGPEEEKPEAGEEFPYHMEHVRKHGRFWCDTCQTTHGYAEKCPDCQPEAGEEPDND